MNLFKFLVGAATITVGDFTGAFAGLAIESNWTNNFCSAVSFAFFFCFPCFCFF